MSESKSRATQAYEAIRADILSCRLQPGQKLTISDLCKALDLNLGAVREALSRLTSEELVEAERNKGFRVAPITQSELEDLTQTRILIETKCLENAIMHGDLKWESAIVAKQFELSKLNPESTGSGVRLNETWSRTHKEFHEALVSACDSPWLLRIREILYAQSERYRSASLPLGRVGRDIAAEHKAIADATIARDITAASEAMRRHLTTTTRILIDADAADGAEGG